MSRLPWLANRHGAICLDTAQLAFSSTRPYDFENVDLRGLAQSEVKFQPRSATGTKTRCAARASAGRSPWSQ